MSIIVKGVDYAKNCQGTARGRISSCLHKRCGLYIERNPVDAGLVKMPEFYPWSSYCAYAFGKKDYIIDRDPLFETLGKDDIERRKVYIEMMNSTLKYFKEGKIDKLEPLGLQLEYSQDVSKR